MLRQHVFGTPSKANRNSKLLNTKFSTKLNFYDTLPSEEITIEDFEQLAINRLQLLKGLEMATIRNQVGAELDSVFQNLEDKFLPMNVEIDEKTIFKQRRDDFLSHFVLRLAFCRNDELRQWFIKFETLLFRLRYSRCTGSERDAFIKKMNFDYKMVSQEDRKRLGDRLQDLYNCIPRIVNINNIPFDTMKFYQVPFEKVPELVSRRQVLMDRGVAIVPQIFDEAIFVEEFKLHLSKAVNSTALALPYIDEDERLLPVLSAVTSKSFSSVYESNRSKNAGNVMADQVDQLSEHFPLCMKNLNSALKANAHLRHGGRLQFSLFLKSIGLPVEEALVYWRRAFSKTSDDDFRKQYQYNIRHNYGLEGKRVEYGAMSCERIISGNAPTGLDNHGCPFKHFSEAPLRELIKKENPSASIFELREMMDMVKNKHYTMACTKYFELTHPKVNKLSSIQQQENSTEEPTSNPTAIDLSVPIVHPNQYYDFSLTLAKSERSL